MKRRILTLQIEILDSEKATWIWDNHMGKDTDNGILVTAIQNGEIPPYEIDIYESREPAVR